MTLQEIMVRWDLSKGKAQKIVEGIKCVPAHFEAGRKGRKGADYDGDQVARKIALMKEAATE